MSCILNHGLVKKKRPTSEDCDPLSGSVRLVVIKGTDINQGKVEKISDFVRKMVSEWWLSEL